MHGAWYPGRGRSPLPAVSSANAKRMRLSNEALLLRGSCGGATDYIAVAKWIWESTFCPFAAVRKLADENVSELPT